MTEAPWVDRQLRRRGIHDERVLAAMARVPLAGTSYIPGQTEERTLTEIKALLEKHLTDGTGRDPGHA